jgi:hypothetical protein
MSNTTFDALDAARQAYRQSDEATPGVQSAIALALIAIAESLRTLASGVDEMGRIPVRSSDE